MKASVILATYNQPLKLAAALYSLLQQDTDKFEVVVADDGSKEETWKLIEKFTEAFGKRLIHQWQEDKGFRKARILNRSIHVSKADRLIFMDGDTMAHPKFVSDHLAMKDDCDVFLGRRVMLSPQVSEYLEANPHLLGSFQFWKKLFFSISEDIPTKHLNRGLRMPKWLRKTFSYDKVPDLIGSNFSVDRAWLYKVNGFDESHVHYGNEDGDLFIRLRNAGAVIRGSKCYAVQWHLWHKERSFQEGAEELYNKRLREDLASKWTDYGLRPSAVDKSE